MSLTREQWIARVLALTTPAGETPHPNVVEYAEAMACYHYDQLIAEGSEPATPEAAIQDEIEA